jgi:aspartyl-tRNA(Asn)/glutamyl-tRNA(Gln) amidotransferase subunit C
MSSTKISLDELKHIAHLARLEIDPKKEEPLATQLSETASYIDILSKLDTKNVEPTFQTNHLKNVTRTDEIQESLTQTEALSQAPETYNGYFKTQATINKK